MPMPHETRKAELIQLREALGISQGQLARKLQISQSTISRFENGEPTSEKVLAEIGKLLRAYAQVQPVARELLYDLYRRGA